MKRKANDSDFDKWYSVYPRKIGKHDAKKAYIAAVNRGAKPEAMLQAVIKYELERRGQDKNFTPYPGTYLRAGRWEDEDAMPIGTPVQMFEVYPNTPEWEAWHHFYGRTTKSVTGLSFHQSMMRQAKDFGRSYSVPSPLPPDNDITILGAG